MYVRHSAKYQKPIKIIHPGEYYVSDENELIGTLLGSCVAVCIFDSVSGIAGMNHFMLPGRISSSDIFADRSARYGITAINELIAAIERRGGVKSNFISKIFGGGHMIEVENKSSSIPLDNIRLARIMMEMEDIPILTEDVGAHFTRKLLMDTNNGKVFLKKTTREDILNTVTEREKEFVRRKFRNENYQSTGR